MKDWQEEFRRKLVPAEEAVKVVKSGDRVAFTTGREAHAVGLALAARKEELRDVKIFVPTPGYDFGWYDRGWEDSFVIFTAFPLGINREMVQERRCDLYTGGLTPFEMEYFKEGVDVLLTEVSPPDEKGFCSFGSSLWNKRRQVQEAKVVIAEVNKNLIRTYGDNYVHVSEIDYFVEHIPTGETPGATSLLGKKVKKEPDATMKQIAKNVAQLIKDGDTFQVGVGRTTEPLVTLGILDGRNDIGYHSEATVPGVIRLVREGVINGKYKNVRPGKVVVTSIGGDTREEMQWVHMNPLFELVDVDYLEDVRVISAIDNFVAINQALAIDLHGQITAESLGAQLFSNAGGQIAFQIGALLSKGGRAITVLPSTAQDGKVSRIMPVLPEGTTVTIHKNLVDIVVTEWGIARLRGKSRRQKAEELINIAHPDFRDELRAAAKKLFWPD
jgi:4-hydroxybutyrate CoA-transferase